MTDALIQEGRAYCLSACRRYSGKLGAALLTQLLLSMEKLALEQIREDPCLHAEGLLLGIYFHDVGRTIGDGDDHGQHSYTLFEQQLAGRCDPSTGNIVRDCCLNHGSKAAPQTREGALVQELDKTVVFEPEVMLTILAAELRAGRSLPVAYRALLGKLEKWLGKIPDAAQRRRHQRTLEQLKAVL